LQIEPVQKHSFDVKIAFFGCSLSLTLVGFIINPAKIIMPIKMGSSISTVTVYSLSIISNSTVELDKLGKNWLDLSKFD